MTQVPWDVQQAPVGNCANAKSVDSSAAPVTSIPKRFLFKFKTMSLQRVIEVPGDFDDGTRNGLRILRSLLFGPCQPHARGPIDYFIKINLNSERFFHS